MFKDKCLKIYVKEWKGQLINDDVFNQTNNRSQERVL